MTENVLVSAGLPPILLVDDSGSEFAILAAALENSGWHVQSTNRAALTAVIGTIAPVSLVLLCNGELADSIAFASELRALSAPNAAVPIIHVGADTPPKTDPKSSQVDAILSMQGGIDSLVQQLESWRPVSLEPTRRIAEIFGAGPIAGMIERLANRLEAALVGLRHGEFDQGEAHRLAGLCGTLGFRQAHAAWLDLSLGDQAAVNEVRRTTRLTLAAIAHGL